MAASKISSNSSSALIINKTLDGICAQISAIYFDLDNTLIPTRAGDSKAIRKLTDVLEQQFGFNKDESTLATSSFLKAFRRCPDNTQTSLDSWRTYLWRESLPLRHKHLADQIYPKWLQLRYRYLALTNDYVQLLKRLRRAGYALALITNGPSNAQWEKVQKLNVQQYFDCVLVSSDLPWEKPHPNIFYAACKFLNVKPQQCAMIGDKLETDIKGGHLAKLGLTFWTPLSSNSTDDLSDVEYRPHVTLNNLLELYKYFPKANALAPLNGAPSSATASSSSTTSSSSSSSSSSSTMSSSSSSSTTSTLSSSMSASTAVASASITGDSMSCSLASTSSVVGGCGGGGGGGAQNHRRRCSQIATCDVDKQQQQQQHQHGQQFYYQQQQQQKQQQKYGYQKQPNYKRGSSLPAMECGANSETENSCDSMFS